MLFFPVFAIDIPPNVQTCQRSNVQLSTARDPLTPLESALPKGAICNSFGICTYKTSRICIKTNDFNPFRICNYKTARLAQKTQDFNSSRINTYTISDRNPLRIRTSKKGGGRVCEGPGTAAFPKLSSRVQRGICFWGTRQGGRIFTQAARTLAEALCGWNFLACIKLTTPPVLFSYSPPFARASTIYDVDLALKRRGHGHNPALGLGEDGT